MSKFPTAFFQNVVTGPSGTKCATVTITPDEADKPIVVSMSTTQTSGHIFYRIGNIPGKNPEHIGDSATPPTVRIGTNSGTVNISGATQNYLTALCYQDGFLDSDVTVGTYNNPGP